MTNMANVGRDRVDSLRHSSDDDAWDALARREDTWNDGSGGTANRRRHGASGVVGVRDLGSTGGERGEDGRGNGGQDAARNVASRDGTS